MAEYDIDFGKKLAEAARVLLELGVASQEAKRTVVYLSLLSTEISLKAMLEKAGMDPKQIRRRSHRLHDLLKDLCHCEIEIEIAPGSRVFVSAAKICPIPISYEGIETPVGRLICAEQEGASVYPNEVRYGANFRHFPAEVLVGMADATSRFASEYWATLRVKTSAQP